MIFYLNLKIFQKKFLSVLEEKWRENHEIYFIGAQLSNNLDSHMAHLS